MGAVSLKGNGNVQDTTRENEGEAPGIFSLNLKVVSTHLKPSPNDFVLSFCPNQKFECSIFERSSQQSSDNTWLKNKGYFLVFLLKFASCQHFRLNDFFTRQAL